MLGRHSCLIALVGCSIVFCAGVAVAQFGPAKDDPARNIASTPAEKLPAWDAISTAFT